MAPTLYALTFQPELNVNVGPNPWKSILDFGILGVEYSLKTITQPEIRGAFSVATNNPKVTVPTLHDHVGEYITDSWKIAEWLEEHHGNPDKPLFPGGQPGRALAKFLESWADNDLAPTILPLFGPFLYTIMAPSLRPAFLKNKFNNKAALLSKMIDRTLDPGFVVTQAAVIRSKLRTLETHLRALRAQGLGPFLAGTSHPTHADACVFGWYASSLIRTELVSYVWKHKDLPLVGEWVDAVQEASGVRPEYSEVLKYQDPKARPVVKDAAKL